MSSKLDRPPPYEEAVQQPKYENPQQPPQDSALPPPPSYSPSPQIYWGPEGAYPQGGYPQGGYPQGGYPQGGYPQGGATTWAAAPGTSPSGPANTIPTLSAGLPGSYSEDAEEFESERWESTSVRHGFIRKVYLILTAQLAVTFSIVCIFIFVDPVRRFVIRYPSIFWASLVTYFIVYCILICCKETRRRFPWNLVLLGVFTLALSYVAGTISSYYETKAVFLAMGITGLICIAVTIFCFQTKVDFTSCGGLLSIASILLVIIGIVAAVVLCFHYVPWLHMLYAAIGAIVYTLFLVYNTQLLIGNRELSLGPEEYVYGTLSLYVDVVHIFFFVLQVSGAATE